ncbi:trehalose-phosphatase [Candidatus Mycobacterium wuenschmannii]|uniref:Trehalose 6-phosphate phosphatase n=1 Tax=Candidatus Mycobacterium wuenschmannii TaxID=3027808 RepID=A0ABY8W1N1_9MYCO|nr:trehalose-phosphatase [Candidatus Mycobacterium wuenschmannii]WIM87699.1 trehalose-phosphatase [Candidatus Mycobacterium wuenschmannii]
MPVTIDPRRIDTVLFDDEPDATFAARLADAGIRVGRSDDAQSVRIGRSAVVASTEDSAEAARAAGFALVIGRGDVADVDIRTGDRRMSELPDGMQALDVARKPAVFYDFDGTLSEIVNDPAAARLVDGAADALTALCNQCPVAILSGRDLADVRDRVGLPGLWYAGSHGFELTGPDGQHHQNAEAAASIPVLTEAARELADQLGGIAGVAVEHKQFGVAVHYRNAARDRVGEVLATVRQAGQRTSLRVTTGREVIELRPDVDWDKGKTLRWVLDYIRDNQGGGPLLPIYLGDDITDEDAFDAVADDGVAILVRHDDDGDRATAARYALESPDKAREFTARLADRVDHKTACD